LNFYVKSAGRAVAWSWLFLLGTSIPIAGHAQELSAPIAGLQRNVIFTEYSPLSRSSELTRRILSPLAMIEIALAAGKLELRPEAVDLKEETFSIFVPVRRPSQGYALLVFIPPWQDGHLPSGWATVLDEQGMIFVSAAKSGNEENVIDRRIPLALLGAYNIMQRYPIDPSRVYIGGFSGGARVALRTALAYPDLFRGALLNAGSDPLGHGEAVLPPEDLFVRFQSSSRLVYVTGSEDSWNLQHDFVSRASMDAWCVFDTAIETMFRVDHEIAAPNSLRRALMSLDKRSPADSDKLSACRARVAKEMAADLHHVAELLEQGKPHDAWHSLHKVDIRYGGLAAPEITRLEQQIGSRR
jgi:hypothetical protein